MRFFATKTNHGYAHFYGSRVQLMLCGDNNPVEVEVTEKIIAEGETVMIGTDQTQYFAWRTEDGKFHHIYQAEFLVRMCAPDGFKSAENRGEGRICSVDVVEIKK